MFGLSGGGKKGKKEEEFLFDLEIEMKDPKKEKELRTQIEDKIQQLKTALRGGESKENFEKLGTLLLAYVSVLKVIDKIVLQHKGGFAKK
jgi:DNA-binding transcriptional regulator GbsR (MarR family)